MVETQQAATAGQNVAPSKGLTLAEFNSMFKGNLKTPVCLPEFFADLCQGWTQETLKSLFMTMTKRNNIPIKLWIDSPTEMRSISNKRPQLNELFQWLDYKGLGRINTLELFAVILVAIDGSMELVINNIMLFFGFQSQQEFFRDELHFFFDCLIRGLMNLVICKNDLMPRHRGCYVSHPEIVKLVKKVFPDKTESIERSQFLSLYMENRSVKDVFQHFSATFYTAIKLNKQRNFDRLLYRQVLRTVFLNMFKNVSTIAEDRAEQRTQGKDVAPILEESRTVKQLIADISSQGAGAAPPKPRQRP